MTRSSTAAVSLGVCFIVGTLGLADASAETAYRSHPPVRPLPAASHRPLDEGPVYFVDPERGDDRQQGTRQAPWKTIGRGLKSLKPGDTLGLRGGRYYERVKISVSGTEQKPVTIRAYPGELAIVDGGLREFFDDPAHAWEPAPQGVEGEFRSTKTYKAGGGFGNFADSMVPFHRYLTFHDLRSTNEFFRPELSNRADDPTGIYAGPGVRRDRQTGRIHIRLSHTRLAGLGENHYRGETDPRKLPLVISGREYTLEIAGAGHVRIQDLVVRGGQRAAVRIADSQDIELDGVTLYGSQMALRVSGVDGLRLTDSALRGHAAPWHSRFHHKNRAGSGYLVLAEGDNTDFEFAHCEFTDHHDGLLLRAVDEMRFHHNLVDNFNDDGIEPGPKRAGRRLFVYQNVISRCLSPFTAHGNKPVPVEHETGDGVFIFRNLVDLRQGTYKAPPREPDPSGAYLNTPTTILAHDHGSPAWPAANVYHNTFLMANGGWRGYYAFTWGAHMRHTTRRVFNNIFVQVEGEPGENFSALSPESDFQSDGNLFWSIEDGPRHPGGFLAEFRRSALFEASRKQYPPGWAAHDFLADPKFVSLGAKPGQEADLRLQKESPAINAGVPIPAKWPDPLREFDSGQPDIGALPFGADALRVGPDVRDGE